MNETRTRTNNREASSQRWVHLFLMWPPTQATSTPAEAADQTKQIFEFFFAVRALKTANKPSSFPCNTATNALSKERFRP